MTGAFIFAISPSDEPFTKLEHFPAKDEKPDSEIPAVDPAAPPVSGAALHEPREGAREGCCIPTTPVLLY